MYNRSKYKESAKFKDLTEVLDNNTLDDFEVVDWDETQYGNQLIQKPQEEQDDYISLQQGNQIVNDENLGQYMPEIADEGMNFEEIKSQMEQEGIMQETTPEDVLPYKKPESETWSTGNAEKAIDYAIKNKETIEIVYHPIGRRGAERILTKDRRLTRRHRIENPGSTTVVIDRIVEPHYIFNAKNGNRIVVTWDRSMGGIRAFILSRIERYKFRNRGFKDRKKMRNPIQEINAMKDLQNKLNKVATVLESKNLVKTAKIIKDASGEIGEVKIAQYVGSQGYWIRNRRCWDNCYRTKRTQKPESPAQEVWTECWGEYLKSINNDDSGWEKYADENDNIVKISYSSEDKKFVEAVKNRESKDEVTKAEAIYLTIEDESFKNFEKIANVNKDLLAIAESLKDGGFQKEAEEVVEVASQLIKDAGLLGSVKDWWSKNFGGVKKIVEKLRGISMGVSRVLSYINKQQFNPTSQATTSQATTPQATTPQATTPQETTPQETTPQSAAGAIPPNSKLNITNGKEKASPGAAGAIPPKTKLKQPYNGRGRLPANAKLKGVASVYNNLFREGQVNSQGQNKILLDSFFAIYKYVSQAITEFSSQVSQQGDGSVVSKYLNPAIDNLQIFVDQANQLYQSKSLNQENMIGLLQKLNQASISAMRGLSLIEKQEEKQTQPTDSPQSQEKTQVTTKPQEQIQPEIVNNGGTKQIAESLKKMFPEESSLKKIKGLLAGLTRGEYAKNVVLLKQLFDSGGISFSEENLVGLAKDLGPF